MRQKILCKLCGSIGHNADACIIHCPNFLRPSLRINMDQFNALHGDEPNETPRECNIQPPESYFRSRTSPLNTSPVVSSIIGGIIIMLLIMVMLRFTLHSFQLNWTLNIFQIKKPLRLNQLMMMKWTIYWNYFTQKNMNIFCVLTYRWFRLDWW